MLNYTIKRLLYGCLTVFFIITATFFAMHSIPGDPLLGEKKMDEQTRKNLEEKYGLDKSLGAQYLIFLKNLAQGDLGISFTQKNRSINDIIKGHFPVSAKLGVMALFFAAIGGIVFGAITAVYRNKWPDVVIVFFVILSISVPSFVFAALAQLVMVSLNKSLEWSLTFAKPQGFIELIIPALILGLGTMAFLTRLMRSSMLEVVNTDYIRTAKAKGISPIQIFFKHQLRNAILPVITVLGPSIASITVGSFVVESVFAIDGLGTYFVNGVQQNDYTLIMGTTVFYGSFLVLMVLVVDLIYGFIDPRIQVEK